MGCRAAKVGRGVEAFEFRGFIRIFVPSSWEERPNQETRRALTEYSQCVEGA